MVKLNKQMQKKINEAEEWGDFTPVPDGRYRLRLMETSLEEGAKGPYIKWTFKIEDGDHAGSQQWLNTSFAAPGAVKMVFGAFGVGPDTDTEELHGQVVGAWIAQELIKSGNRKGEMGNSIKQLFPDGEGDEEGDDEEEPF